MAGEIETWKELIRKAGKKYKEGKGKKKTPSGSSVSSHVFLNLSPFTFHLPVCP